MKNSIRFLIMLAVIFVVGSIFIASRNPKKTKNIVQTAISIETESPYSLKWGSELMRVIDQSGDGVPDAMITLTKRLSKNCEGKVTEEPPAWQDTVIETNKKGEFAVPAEIWAIDGDQKKPTIYAKIEATGFLPRANVGIGVNYGTSNRGEIDLFRIGTIEGIVVDPNGHPLPNAPVWLNTSTHYKSPNESYSGRYGTNTKTDENGSFIFEKVPQGLHVIKFPGHAGGCKPEEKTIIPFKEYATFQMVDMKDGDDKYDVFLDLRQNRGTIAGKVVDKYNRPMAGVQAILFKVVKIYDPHGWSSFTENLKSVLTNKNGEYLLDLIPPGDYQLQAQYPYQKGKHYKSGKPLNIYLADKQTLSFNLVLERQDNSLPKPDHKQNTLFPVPLPDDMGPREMMIIDQQGTPIAGASVVFADTITSKHPETKKQTSRNWPGATLATDENGRLTLPDEIKIVDKKIESCRMTIKADGFKSRHTGTDYYRINKDPRIDLLKVASISGRVLDKNGRPAKAIVSVRNSMTAHINPQTSSTGGGCQIMPSKNGQFELHNLPDGIHVIHYSHQPQKNEQPIKGATVAYIQNGQNIEDFTIDLRQANCTIRGRVLDHQGKPTSKAKIRLTKELHLRNTTWQPIITESDPTNRKGQYEIANVNPGVYEVQAILAEGKNTRMGEKMTIALADGQTVDIDLRL